MELRLVIVTIITSTASKNKNFAELITLDVWQQRTCLLSDRIIATQQHNNKPNYHLAILFRAARQIKKLAESSCVV
jgi:hypothetical protein